MKQKLFEDIRRIKTLMNINEGEAYFESSEKKIIDEFIDFVKKELNIKNDVEVKLQNDKEGIKTTAVYKYQEDGDDNFENSEVRVFALGRELVDVLRSIAHELVHHQQNEEGRLKNASGEPGSDVENEANAEAGELVRKFGEKKPEIYPEGKGELDEDDGETDTGGESSTPPPSDSGGGSDSGTESGGGEGYPTVTKWETGLTRGPANTLTISVWSLNITRGKANQLGNTTWDSGINRGKANTLI